MKTNRWLTLLGCTALSGIAIVAAGCSSGEAGNGPGTAPVSSGSAQEQVFTVRGMHCDGCAGAVTAALEKLPGVESVSVSFEESRAVVVGDPSRVTVDAVIAAVAKTDCEAEPVAADSGTEAQ